MIHQPKISFAEFVNKFGLKRWQFLRLENVLEPKAFEFKTDIMMLCLGINGLLFCAIHLIVWNWDFPSPLAIILWRVFAVTTASVSLTSIIQLYYLDSNNDMDCFFVTLSCKLVLAVLMY